MKGIGVFAIIALAVTLGACGASSSSTNPANVNPANGAWSETLSSATAQPLGSFTFTMTQSNATLTGNNMNFANMGSLDECFGTGTVMNGQMGQGMMNGGTMAMNVCWTAANAAGSNCMAMHGNMGMGMHSGSGTFTLTGETPGCTSQQGTFTMTHM